MKHRVLIVHFCCLAQLLCAAEFHVSPSGDDAHGGTFTQPFATFARAQRAVRELPQDARAQSVKVVVHGGTYRLSEPLVFDPRDSGKPDAPVVYQAAPGARPVLSGGQRITGWKARGQYWVAEVPEAKNGQWRFKELFVNGERRTRSRIPNAGFLRVAGCPEGTPKTVNYHKDCQSFEFAPGDLRADWRNLREVEVIVYHFWTDSHLPIQSIDTNRNVVTFAHKAGKVFTDDFTEEGARYVVENVFEGLDAPGEWYLDAEEGLVYYLPREGEDLSRADVVAPALPRFIELRGNPRERQFVEHITFRGLGFKYSHFELPKGNSNDQQGSASVPAAVLLAGARNCRFEACDFRNLGTWAIEAGKGCRGNVFAANRVSAAAAGGFRINGGTDRDHPLERTAENTIADNRLTHYGQVYPSAVGILLMHTEGNTVAHNEIAYGYYTGISVGWVWGYGRSISQANCLEYNHIHHLGQGLLSDMGGIYTLGVSPGTTIRNNLIHDVDANRYGGWGIYHDEGSTHLLVESNVVYNTKFAPFNIHFAKEVTVRNNIFALGRLEQVSRTRQEPHQSVFFENNIVYWRAGELFSKNWKDAPHTFYFHPKDGSGTRTVTNTFTCDWNVYFNPDKMVGEVQFGGGSWEAWRDRGKDRNSVYGDPQFEDPEAGDFRLKPGSPAWALGFRSIDLRHVGPSAATARPATR